MDKMYKEAIVTKLRFKSSKGALSLEQVADLPLASESRDSLNSLAITVSRELKASQEESFVSDVSPSNAVQELRLNLLKDLIATRKAERDAKVSAKLRKERKAYLESLVQVKSQQQDQERSLEDIQKELEALKSESYTLNA